MDVLQVIKEDHDVLRAALSALETTTKVADRRKYFDELNDLWSKRVQIESQYLFPEVSGLFPEAEVLSTLCLAQHKVIKKLLSGFAAILQKPASEQTPAALSKRLEELREHFDKHLDGVEKVLMPKMRMLIPTGDREDLGQLFLDLRNDLDPAGAAIDLKATDKTKKRA